MFNRLSPVHMKAMDRALDASGLSGHAVVTSGLGSSMIDLDAIFREVSNPSYKKQISISLFGGLSQ